MKKVQLLSLLILSSIFLNAQGKNDTTIVQITNDKNTALPKATVELLKSIDSSLVKIQVADSSGTAYFMDLPQGNYVFRISNAGYSKYITNSFMINNNSGKQHIKAVLQNLNATLEEVTVTSRKPFIEIKPDKTIVNLEGSITNIGSTAMEAIEKLPGVTVDKDGNISLKGRTGVLLLIDGKPTYLGSSELASLLNGMSASQIQQIEIMDQPSSRYDAAGNAGVINLKTKKNQQKGFNSNMTVSYSQGKYFKNNNNASLNYRSGKFNLFANYSLNRNKNFTRLYALRTYLEPDESTTKSFLEQPSFMTGENEVNNIRTGIDFFMNQRTTFGLTLTGLKLSRSTEGNNPAIWMNAQRGIDSTINTKSEGSTNWQNGGLSLNFKHSFTKSKELSADFDVLEYKIRNTQFFENTLTGTGGYTEASRGFVPSDINILSAKADYSQQSEKIKWETGWKSSRIKTNNLSDFDYKEGNTWKDDLNRSNHFLYTENIHAFYTNAETTIERWTIQGGMRYEFTHYDANQLGNAVQKDSSFSRNYNSLFPSVFISYAADSSHNFSITAGRRIDRPAFQKLNPFLVIINKYTFQQGNPFYRPQYTWNFELTHTYKHLLTTSLNYSLIHDYFSQIFPINENGIVLYTEGNLPKMQNFGMSLGIQLTPAKWWSLSAQAVVNHKKIEGTLWKALNPNITEAHFSTNNQFRFAKTWSVELTGLYNTRGQTDIQEIVYPSGQLSVGLAKNLFKNKGTIKLAFRDIFYTQWMEGFTYFRAATEYFKLTRDTKVGTISFIYRFGKSFKTTKRSEGAAGEEIQRVGNG